MHSSVTKEVPFRFAELRFLLPESPSLLCLAHKPPVQVIPVDLVQGRGAQADVLMQDAKAVAEAGAFSVVLEKTPEGLSDRITAGIEIPTIGIGASAGCDGQILVVDDMLGLFTAFKAKFVKRYADLGDTGEAAIAAYAADVRARRFPAPEHVFSDAAPNAKSGQ